MSIRAHMSRYHASLLAETGCERCNRPHVDPGALESYGGVLLCCQCADILETVLANTPDCESLDDQDELRRAA